MRNLFWMLVAALPFLALSSWVLYGPVLLSLILTLLFAGLIGLLIHAYSHGNLRPVLRKLGTGLMVYLLIILVLLAYQFYLSRFGR